MVVQNDEYSEWMVTISWHQKAPTPSGDPSIHSDTTTENVDARNVKDALERGVKAFLSEKETRMVDVFLDELSARPMPTEDGESVSFTVGANEPIASGLEGLDYYKVIEENIDSEG